MRKIAVIGGGPGGLSAAREAAVKGLSVTLFEKNRIGEKINCAEGFFDLLKLLEPPIAGIHYKVKRLEVSAIDTFSVDCSHLNLWTIDRPQWQKALAEDAARLGCRIYENTPVTAESYSRLQKDYEWIIDAGGIGNASRVHFNLPRGEYAYSAQHTLQGDFSGLQDSIKAVFEPHYCGYYWIFPKTKESANVGVGWFGRRDRHLNISRELQRILKKEKLDSARVLRKSGGPIPVQRRADLVLGNTLLAGDAAGLCSSLHGGGVDTACISGILAARAVAAGEVGKYAHEVDKIICFRLYLERKILEYWQRLDYKKLNELFASCFVQDKKKLGTGRIREAISREAAFVRFVLSGKFRGDWKKGIITEGMPLPAKIYMRTVKPR